MAFYTKVTEDEEGVYTIKEVSDASDATDWRAFPHDFFKCFDDNVVPISYKKGSLNIEGFVNCQTLGLGFQTVVDSHRNGPFFGNLKDGLSVTYDLKNTSVKKLRLLLKNGNEVHVDTDGSQTKAVTLPM